MRKVLERIQVVSEASSSEAALALATAADTHSLISEQLYIEAILRYPDVGSEVIREMSNANVTRKQAGGRNNKAK